MRKRVITGFILLFTVILCFGQKTKIDSLFQNFKQASFYEKVYPAKKKLENYQNIIPRLIELLNDTSFVKLTNTADLIYPGATNFWGHGQFIPYDMDWISVRAGWLLEDLTFMNFGYKTSGINDSSLFKLMKENYSQYLEKGTYDLEWKNKPARAKSIEYRKILAQKVKIWWQTNQTNWTRLSAMKDALKSENENRLFVVLQFLRYGETKCEGLNSEVYLSDIKPLLISLQQTKYKFVKEQIDLLLGRNSEYWTKRIAKMEKNNN